MIHMQSLSRCLASVPWMLAFGLVLGWAGEAVAQHIELSVDKAWFPEDGGAVTIKVTAKTYNAAGEHAALGDRERVVLLSSASPFYLKNGPDAGRNISMADGFGRRFTLVMPSIVIPKDQKEVSVDAVFTPIPTNEENDPNAEGYVAVGRIPNWDLHIYLSGDAGPTPVVYTGPYASDSDFDDTIDSIRIVMMDTDKTAYQVLIEVDPRKISKEAEATDVTVTASVDGKPINGTIDNRDLTFRLGVLSYDTGSPEAQRDVDYDITLSSITIPKRKSSATTTITIAPKNAGTGEIFLGSRDWLTVSGIPVNGDDDVKDSWTAYGQNAAGEDDETVVGATIPLYEDGFRPQIDLNGDGFINVGSLSVSVSPELVDHDGDSNTDNVYRYVEANVPTDLDRDGTATDGFDLNADGDIADALATVSESDFYRGLPLQSVWWWHSSGRSNTIQITDTPIAATKGLTASPQVIRESLVGQTEGSREVEVTLNIELANDLPDDARVEFFVRDELTQLPEDFIDGAQKAKRGTDYRASVDELVIPAGQKKGTTTLNLTIFDNDGKNEPKVFRVEAKVGTVSKYVGIKIADDETATTTIALSADPGEIKAETGERTITIKGKLNGDVLDEDQTITLAIVSGDKAATRDVDYTAVLGSLKIKAGETESSTTVLVTPRKGGDKNVWIGVPENDPFTKNRDGDDVTVSPVKVVLKNADPVDKTAAPGVLSLGPVSTVYDGKVGTALDIELPEATGGAGDRLYSVSNTLPAGLSFDATTRIVSGTPTTVGTTEVVYAVIDAEGSAATKFTIEIAAADALTNSVASVSVSRTSVREDGDSASISVKATLVEPASVAETIRFTLGAPNEGVWAIRDIDFSASLHSNVAIAEGATEATTVLTLAPIDNTNPDGNRVVGVHATASGGSASADITIADDESASTSISLSADPHTVSEGAGPTEITITATLDGKGLDADTTVTVSIDPDSEAMRDVDYSAQFQPHRHLTIPVGAVSGSIDILLDPFTDPLDEGNETITLHGAIDGLADGIGLITITDVMVAEMDPLAFAEGAMIDDISATAGTAVAAVTLPEAAGGSGDISYSVSELPAGLSFDAATRTVSGTPEGEGTTEVTYTATAGDESVSLTFSITVNPMLDLSALFDLSNEGAGKRVPLLTGLNADARMYLDVHTALPSVGEDFVLAVRLADFVAIRGYGLQVQYDADKLAFIEVRTDQPQGGNALAAPQVLADEAGVLTVAALGEVVSEGEVALSLIFRATTDIENTIIEITDSQAYDSAFGFNRLALPTPVSVQTRPTAFSLANNYPNPFNPVTTLQYALPQAVDVKLTVYNVVGQPVRTLVAEHQSAGRYVVEWDATTDSGHSLSSGMYFYRLRAGEEFHEVKKMLLLK